MENAAYVHAVELRIQKERSREARRDRNHSLHRLTWVMSQQDHPSFSSQQEEEDDDDEEEVQRFTQELHTLVCSWKLDTLKELLISNVAKPDFLLFLKSVFENSKTKSGFDRLLLTFETVLDLLCRTELQRRDDVIAELLGQTKLLPDRALAYLAERSFAVVGKSEQIEGVLELFVKLVSRMSVLPKGELDPESKCSVSVALLDGRQFKWQLFKELCALSSLSDKAMIPWLSALKDLVHEEAAQWLLCDLLERRVCQNLPRFVTCSNFPLVCFHFFSLCNYFPSRGGHFVLDFFESQTLLDKHTFGAVLVKCSLVCAQDTDFAKSLLSELSIETQTVTKTKIGFLLSLSRVKRLEKSCFDVFSKHHHRHGSESNGVLESSLLEIANELDSPSWDIFLPVLIKVCIGLAETTCKFAGHPSLDLSPKCNNVSISVLSRCFQLYPMCRAELLAELVKRALSATHTVLPFIRLLKYQRAIVLKEHMPVAKELISLLPSCLPRIAHGVLLAFFGASPLDEKRALRDLQDHAMVVFRKTLFVRELQPRMVALFGMLVLAKREEEEEGDDALHCLKRCLSQQLEVRSALYAGLLPLSNSDLVVHAYFTSHYLESTNDVDLSPLQFEKCLQHGRVVEPLPLLLRATLVSEFDASKIVERLGNAQLPTFSLDKTCTFESGNKNRVVASQVIESCEVLMDYCGVQKMQDVAMLWRVQRAMRRLVENNGKDATFSSSNNGTNKRVKVDNEDRFILPVEGALLSENFLLSLLEQTLAAPVSSMITKSSSVTATNRSDAASLLSRAQFHMYLLNAVKARLQLVARLVSSSTPLSKKDEESLVFSAKECEEMSFSCAGGKVLDPVQFCVQLGPLLFQASQRYLSCESLLPTTTTTADPTPVRKAKKNAVTTTTTTTSPKAPHPSSSTGLSEVNQLYELSLECLKDVVHHMVQAGGLHTIICATFRFSPSNSDSLYQAACRLHSIAANCFAQQRIHAGMAALEMFQLVLQEMSDRSKLDHFVGLVRELLATYELKSSTQVKFILSLYLKLNHELHKGDLILVLSELVQQVCFTQDGEQLMMICTPSTSAHVVSQQIVCAHLTTCLELVETELQDVISFALKSVQSGLVLRLEHVCLLLGYLLKAPEEVNIDLELVLKAVAKFYRVWTKFVKTLVTLKTSVAACDDVSRLVQHVFQQCGPLVDEKLRFLQGEEKLDSKPKKKGKQASVKPSKRTAVQAKLVPEVVFVMEQYELTLLKATRACNKSIEHLADFVRRTTARDFKVDVVKLKHALDEERIGREVEEEEDEEEI